MRLTAVVQSMHIGNTFKQIWKVQNTRKVLDFNVRQSLESKGRQVFDAIELLNLKRVPQSTLPIFRENKEVIIDPSIIPKPTIRDHSHPDWHDEPCRIYHDHITLLSGIDESLHVAKTCLVANNLPEKVESFRSKLNPGFHEKIQQAILDTHCGDALQVKLPRAIDLKKPGWRHPRSYGLPRWRRNTQLLNKIFHSANIFLAKHENVDVSQNQFVSEIKVKAPMTLDGMPCLFETNQNNLVFGRKPLQPYVDEETRVQLLSKPLPSIYPLSRTVSIYKHNIYRQESKFPVREGAPFDRLAMAIFHINKPFLKYTGTQLEARLLLHSFTVAAAYAQRHYGKDVKELPEPLTINCMQTDSQNFLFGCLQLHSLDLDSSQAAHNLFWVKKSEPMFVKCDYVNSQPILEGYNPEVMETLMALYQSQMSV